MSHSFPPGLRTHPLSCPVRWGTHTMPRAHRARRRPHGLRTACRVSKWPLHAVATPVVRVYRPTGVMKRAVVAAVLLATFVVQVAVAVPAHAMAGLRAVTCCARGCDHARSFSDAMRCCGVRVGDDFAVTPHVGKPLVPTLVAAPLGASASVSGDALVTSSTRHTPRDRPPPIFLLVRSLRL